MALPVRSMSLTEAVDTTRTGSAWYFDANGVFQEESTSDTARIDYDPNGGARLGLMAEGQITNLLTYSEDLSNAAWTADNATLGTPTTFATNISLDEIVETVDDGSHGFFRNTSESGTHTFACFLKRKSGSRRYAYGRVFASASASIGRYSALVDLDTGLIVDTNVNGNTTVTDTASSRVTDMGGGVYRLQITVTGTNVGVRVAASNSGTPSWDATTNDVEYVGDTGESFYAGGFQFEALPGASSYIPTEGSTVTRAAETHELVSLDPWYRASGYSVAIQYRTALPATAAQTVLSFYRNAGEFFVVVHSDVVDDATKIQSFIGGAVNGEVELDTTPNADTTRKVAVRAEAGNLAASLDGAAAVADSDPDPFALPVPTSLFLGGRTATSRNMYGWIQDLKYTTELWSDAELATESGTTV